MPAPLQEIQLVSLCLPTLTFQCLFAKHGRQNTGLMRKMYYLALSCAYGPVSWGSLPSHCNLNYLQFIFTSGVGQQQPARVLQEVLPPLLNLCLCKRNPHTDRFGCGSSEQSQRGIAASPSAPTLRATELPRSLWLYCHDCIGQLRTTCVPQLVGRRPFWHSVF